VLLIPAATLAVLGVLNAQRARDQIEAAIEAGVIESNAFKKLTADNLFPNVDEGEGSERPPQTSP